MKKILSFLSYHNAIPLAAVVLTMGAGITFAASQGVLPLPAMLTQSVETGAAQAAPEPDEVDPAALLSANLDTFDFRPTVTGVVETDSLYTVSYSIETLAPEEGRWTTVAKTGEFSVAEDSLDESGLQGYIVGKLSDLENQERSYLARAQAAEKALADARTARPANAFAALIGLALDQIPVPVIVRPAPEPLPQTPLPQEVAPTQAAQTTTTDAATSTEPTASVSPQATSTVVTTGDATSTESSEVATTTPVEQAGSTGQADATSTTIQTSDVIPTTDGSNTAATSTADTATTTSQ